MAGDKITATAKKSPRSGFTQIYNAFIDSDLLNQYEKLVFIAIKSFANNQTKQAYPSLATISRITGTSLSTVRRSINHMEELGILDVQHRRNERYGHIQNLYTVHDNPDFWSISNEEDDLEAVAQEISDAKLIAELKKRGYEVTKSIKNEPLSYTDQSYDKDPLEKQSSKNDNIITNKASQERYTQDYLKKLYDYDIMVNDNPEDISLIDYIIQIIYDAVNSTKDTIRVNKEDKPREIVTSVLMKLTHDEIMFVVETYKQQTKKIDYPKAYLLTQLYEAKGQMDATMINQIQHDMF